MRSLPESTKRVCLADLFYFPNGKYTYTILGIYRAQVSLSFWGRFGGSEATGAHRPSEKSQMERWKPWRVYSPKAK